MRILLERHASAELRDADGNTPLLWATREGNSRAVMELLAVGAHEDCFAIALASALRAVREAARRDVARAASMVDDTEVSSARRVTATYARLLVTLVRGGAVVRTDDLASLRLGWNECKARSNRDGAGQRAENGRVASLYSLAQYALANSLTAECVLPTLHVACLVNARRLQSECERLVLQNSRALAEMGAFSAMRSAARPVLQRMLHNALYRSAAFEAARATAAAAGVAIDGHWKERVALEELDLFCSAPPGSSESTASSDGESSDDAEDDEQDM